jgi:hypothetical protein
VELELAKLMARRCAHRPLLLAAWFGLCALPWVLAAIGPLGPDSRSLFSSNMVYEVAFVWGLIGGLAGLSALGDVAVGLDPLGTGRRLRAQTTILGLGILVPALPIVVLSLLPTAREALPAALAGTLLMGLHTVAIGLVTAQFPAGSLRSIAFLSLAWLIPALASAPIRGIVVPVLDATRHLEATSGSSAWPAAFAPILALVLTAIGVDVIRRPAT